MARLIAVVLLGVALIGCARGKGIWTPLGPSASPPTVAGPRIAMPRAATHDALAFVGSDGHSVTLFTDTEPWCFKPGENDRYLFGPAALCRMPGSASPLCRPATAP